MHPEPVHQSSARGAAWGTAVSFWAIHAASSSVSGRGMRTSGVTRRAMPSNHAWPKTCCKGSPSDNLAAHTANRSSSDSDQRFSSANRAPRGWPDACSIKRKAMPSRSSTSTTSRRVRSQRRTSCSTLEDGQGPLPRRTAPLTPVRAWPLAPAIRPWPCWWPTPRCARRTGATACSRPVRGGACPWGRGKRPPRPTGLR